MKKILYALLCCCATQVGAYELDITPQLLPALEQTEDFEPTMQWDMPIPRVKKNKKNKQAQDSWHLYSLPLEEVEIAAKFPSTPQLQQGDSAIMLMSFDPLSGSLYALCSEENPMSWQDYSSMTEAEIRASIEVFGSATSLQQSETVDGLPCWNYTATLQDNQGSIQGRLLFAQGYLVNAFALWQKGGRPQVARFLDSVTVD